MIIQNKSNSDPKYINQTLFYHQITQQTSLNAISRDRQQIDKHMLCCINDGQRMMFSFRLYLIQFHSFTGRSVATNNPNTSPHFYISFSPVAYDTALSITVTENLHRQTSLDSHQTFLEVYQRHIARKLHCRMKQETSDFLNLLDCYQTFYNCRCASNKDRIMSSKKYGLLRLRKVIIRIAQRSTAETMKFVIINPSSSKG